ncbi:hypothetical protein L1049_010231 [Liquidambar formosana]|uniref:galactinol--sucrose galactosyltransferase n=1 Tax=Liquidambar formosana TaxID=63359 RepID=A0AAP0R453_LIQFO
MATTILSPPLRPLHLHARFSTFLSPNQRIYSRGPGVRIHKSCRHSMFLSAKPVLKDGNLSVNGTDALTGVPENVVFTPLTQSSAFVGATSAHTNSRHVFKLGVIQDVRLFSLFRFKLWWMLPRFGNSGSDVPMETQMLLLEAREDPHFEASNGSTSYMVLLPVLDGEFRSSLQGNSANELEFCVESGDPAIVTSQLLKAVFVNCGNNPFDLMKESMKILEKHSGTFAVRETKQMPGILDWFGWCTWDAFYHKVNPQGIKDGLESLSRGGTPARFLIIDDGWQNTSNEFQKEGEPFVEGSQFGGRLVSVGENSKFRKSANEALSEAPTGGLKDFVKEIKSSFGLKYGFYDGSCKFFLLT